MGLEPRLLGGDSVEHTCDTMGDVITNHIFDKEHRQPDTDDREDEVEPVGSVRHEAVRQQILYQCDEFMKNICSKGSKNADGKSQYRRHLSVVEIMLPPRYDFIKHYVSLLFSNDCHFPIGFEFDDRAWGMGLMLLPTGEADVVDTVKQFLTDV